jgi:lipid-binding SYLF domain-containing protein
MSIKRFFLLLVIGSLGIVGSSLAQDGKSAADVRRQEIDLNAQATLDELFEQKGNARALFDQAAGYAVFSATKAGFVVTGGRGTGVAVNKATGERTYMRMLTGGIWLGVGAQNYDLVLFFEHELQLGRFIQGAWDATTTAQAAAGTEGITYAASFVNGVAVYQITDKGLMAQADVSGTRFRVVDDLN